jgi:hypothetical protein
MNNINPRSGFSSATQWHFDESGYYAYVMVDGSQDVVDGMKQALDDHGIEVMLSGQSYRPADNGRQYGWYLRVASADSGRKPSKMQIEKILGIKPLPAPEEIEYLQSELAQTFLTLQTVEKEKTSLLSDLNLARAIEADHMRKSRLLRQQYDRTNREAEAFKAAKQRLEQQVNTLAGELDQARKARELEVMTIADHLNEQKSETSEVILALQSQIVDLRKSHDALQSDNACLESAWVQGDIENQELRSEIQDEQNKVAIALAEKERVEEERDEIIARLQNEMAQKNSAPFAASEGELGRCLQTLLPNVNLTPASIAMLHNEVQDPVNVYKLLENLNSDPTSVRSKPVVTAEGWFEEHFNTGESDLGRVYFSEIGNSKYKVHIGHKNTQKHDIPHLKDLTRKIKNPRIG